ncbi:MAG: hypothetical protein ACSLFB_08050 [Acidimicrobiales bacterium]
MEIIAALFVDNFAMRQVAGPSTRIDLTGVYFSMAAPSPVPVMLEPHLVVMIRCPADASANAVLETVFMRGDEEIARNVQPVDIEPGKFGYRLVRSELTFEEYGSIEARCRIDQGHTITVPLTLLPPAA